MNACVHILQLHFANSAMSFNLHSCTWKRFVLVLNLHLFVALEPSNKTLFQLFVLYYFQKRWKPPLISHSMQPLHVSQTILIPSCSHCSQEYTLHLYNKFCFWRKQKVVFSSPTKSYFRYEHSSMDGRVINKICCCICLDPSAAQSHHFPHQNFSFPWFTPIKAANQMKNTCSLCSLQLYPIISPRFINTPALGLTTTIILKCHS